MPLYISLGRVIVTTIRVTNMRKTHKIIKMKTIMIKVNRDNAIKTNSQESLGKLLMMRMILKISMQVKLREMIFSQQHREKEEIMLETYRRKSLLLR